MSTIQKLLQLQHPNKTRFLLGYALWKSGLCKYVTFSAQGIRLRYYHSTLSRMIFSDRSYTREDNKLLKQYLTAGDIFIDVGANIGTWSIMASRIVGPAGKVLCFEPHPRVFSYLSGNIALNRASNIVAHNVGLSESRGTLFLTDGLDDTNHLTHDAKQGIPIPLETLDHYTADIPSIKLLKIDVEGYEWYVMKGAIQTLRKCENIIFESEPSFQQSAGYNGKEILALLADNGFKVYRTEDGSQVKPDYQSPYCENLLAKRT